MPTIGGTRTPAHGIAVLYNIIHTYDITKMHNAHNFIHRFIHVNHSYYPDLRRHGLNASKTSLGGLRAKRGNCRRSPHPLQVSAQDASVRYLFCCFCVFFPQGNTRRATQKSRVRYTVYTKVKRQCDTLLSGSGRP